MDVATDDEEKKINGETCPNDCNGNGECIKSVCKCYPGFTAFDCSTKVGKSAGNKEFNVETPNNDSFTKC